MFPPILLTFFQRLKGIQEAVYSFDAQCTIFSLRNAMDFYMNYVIFELFVYKNKT